MAEKELRSAYAKARKAATRRSRRLEQAGFKGREFAKVRELTSESELRKALNAATKYATSEKSTVTYQRKAKARRLERRRERYQEKKLAMLGLTDQERQLIKTLRKHGIKVAPEDIKKWEQYLTLRHAIQTDKTKYEFDKWVSEFDKVLTAADEAGKKEQAIEDIQSDFDRFTQEAMQSQERYREILRKTGYKRSVQEATLDDLLVAKGLIPKESAGRVEKKRELRAAIIAPVEKAYKKELQKTKKRYKK